MVQADVILQQIKKKEREVSSLEKKLAEAQIYLQALKDVLKVLEKDEVETEAADGTIKDGSTVDQARKEILRAGRPLHLDDILKALGKNITRESKASLNGSLAAYVRKGEIFSRPKPSTYGLLELEVADSHDDYDWSPEPPDGFGHMGPSSDDDVPF